MHRDPSYSTFNGSINVRSTPTGYAVKFRGETDAHDLGHALAAIMTAYVDRAKKRGAPFSVDEIHESILSGVRCGLYYNRGPLRRN
jgi:hypothetical protein